MKKQVATLLTTQDLKLRKISIQEGKEVKIGLDKVNELEINPSLIVKDLGEFKWIDEIFWLRDLSGQCYRVKNYIGQNGNVPLLNGDCVSFLINGKYLEYTLIIIDEPIQQFVPDLPQDSDFEFVKPSITCVLCQEIFYRPVQINPCNHCFCGYCITQIIKLIKKCPICEKPIFSVTNVFVFDQLTKYYLSKSPKCEQVDQRQALYDSDNMFLKGNKNFEMDSDDERQDYSCLMGILPYQRLIIQQQIQEQYILAQDLNRLECKSCKEEYNNYRCEIQQKHEKCCKYMIPARELSSTENQKLKLFCQLCKGYRCKYYYNNSTCFYNRNFNSLVQWAKFDYIRIIPSVIHSQILKEMDGLVIKFIIDDSMFTKVDKGTFYYESSYTSKENYKELLDYETPLCNKCFELVYSQMIIKYFEVDRMDSLVGKPDCPHAFQCYKILYNDDKEHAEEYNHYCKRQI
ncbi:hypothetical protein pb186bvf_015268 [Paramecium bursaria]